MVVMGVGACTPAAACSHRHTAWTGAWPPPQPRLLPLPARPGPHPQGPQGEGSHLPGCLVHPPGPQALPLMRTLGSAPLG